MAKILCELCHKNLEKDMRFGVKLCDECVKEYDNALRGDMDAAMKLTNPDNFPNATDMAKRNIIGIISKRIKQVEAKEREKKEENLQHKKVEEQEQKRESYAKSVGVSYEEKNQTSESGMDSWYANIGKKIKNWAKWIFIVEAISAVISGFCVLFSDLWWVGLLVIIFGPIVAWVSSWILYAFGELVDKTMANEENTRNILKLMLDSNTKNE